jgi:hypothetical protein
MAIDDNTSYELTGYQVKDLAQKIRGKADDDDFVGAGTSVAGSRGLVPAPAAGDNTNVLKGDGTWGAVASANIDWSTIMTAILSTGTVKDGNWTGVKGLNYFKFDNGLMVVTGQTEVVQINANSHTDKSYNLTTSFTTYPIVVASISTDSNYNKMATVSNFYSTKSTIKLRFYNSDTGESRSPIGTFIAIGMWK